MSINPFEMHPKNVDDTFLDFKELYPKSYDKDATDPYTKTRIILKPINETILETTIGYEQLAVDLTSILAKEEKDPCVKKALDFALLEDFGTC